MWDTRQSSSPIQKTKLSSNGHTFPVYWYVLVRLCMPLAAVVTTAARAFRFDNGDVPLQAPRTTLSVVHLQFTFTLYTLPRKHTHADPILIPTPLLFPSSIGMVGSSHANMLVSTSSDGQLCLWPSASVSEPIVRATCPHTCSLAWGLSANYP